jgi:hypothetical protein
VRSEALTGETQNHTEQHFRDNLRYFGNVLLFRRLARVKERRI